jgi:hypothetical protein
MNTKFRLMRMQLYKKNPFYEKKTAESQKRIRKALN